MKRVSICSLMLCLVYFQARAQNRPYHDNYYAPFHHTIKDSSDRTVMKFGYYIIAGTGIGQGNGLPVISSHYSLAFAYKSWLLSYTSEGQIDPGYFFPEKS